MNMIRCGAVMNLSDWKHTGYHEIIGKKQRYRVIDLKELMNCLGMDDYSRFRDWYIRTLNIEVSKNYCSRIPLWTESAAVGDKNWIESISGKLDSRKKKVLYTVLPETQINDRHFDVHEEKIYYLSE